MTDPVYTSEFENELFRLFGNEISYEWLETNPLKGFIIFNSKKIFFIKSYKDYPCLDLLLTYENHLRNCNLHILNPMEKVALNGEEYFIRKTTVGQTYKNDIKEYERIQKALFEFHEAGFIFPEKNQIYSLAIKIEKELEEIRFNVLSRAYSYAPEINLWLNENFIWFERLFCDFNVFFSCRDGQPMHGDLHPGNVILTETNVVFIDLEEFYKIFYYREYDLSYLKSRFGNFNKLDHQFYKKMLMRLILMVIYNSIFRSNSKSDFYKELTKFKNEIDKISG